MNDDPTIIFIILGIGILVFLGFGLHFLIGLFAHSKLWVWLIIIIIALSAGYAWFDNK